MRSVKPVQMETAQLSEATHCFSFVLRTCCTLIQYEAQTVISLSQLNHSVCATQRPELLLARRYQFAKVTSLPRNKSSCVSLPLASLKVATRHLSLVNDGKSWAEYLCRVD